jgi:hypothetical protein
MSDSTARPASRMEAEMHDRSGLDTAHQQLAKIVRQRTNASGHSRAHLKGMFPRFLVMRIKLRRVSGVEAITKHTLFVSTALSDAPLRQQGPDSLLENLNKVADETYKLVNAISWLEGKTSVGRPKAALDVAHHYLFPSSYTFAISSRIACHIAGNIAPDVQQWIRAALMGNSLRNSLGATESLWTLWYNPTLQLLSEKVFCAVFAALTFLRNGSDECEERPSNNNMSHLLSEIGGHGSDVRVRKLAIHQSDTHMEKVAMEAPSVSSAREPEAQATRSRHTTSRPLSRNTSSPFVPARFSPAYGESERPSSKTNIASTPHGHQTPLLEELSPSSTVQLPCSEAHCVANVLQRIRPCYLLVTLGLAVIGGSLAIGLYYSIAKDRMGDGFTTAGWMTAVGTLILAAPMAKHYPHCKCWETGYTILRHDYDTQV